MQDYASIVSLCKENELPAPPFKSIEYFCTTCGHNLAIFRGELRDYGHNWWDGSRKIHLKVKLVCPNAKCANETIEETYFEYECKKWAENRPVGGL
jgi:hypothetical protein